MSRDALWGEAFASDALPALAGVSDWAELAEGESVRFFPALRARGEHPAAELRRRTLQRADEIDHQAARQTASAPSSEDAAWLRRLINGKAARDEARNLAAMARFAFLTGLHPAYLWPEAEILAAWGATAAWLGELSRCGRAWMPPEVAECLADALTRENGRTVWRDASLSGLAPESRLASLNAAARRRLTGSHTLLDWRGGTARALLERLTTRWRLGA